MNTERLVRLRKSRKMSQELIAGLVGVSHRAYLNWEAGKCEMRAGDLKRIAEILNVSADYLLGEGDDESADSKRESAKIEKFEKNIEIEVELPNKTKVRFSIPPDMREENFGKFIKQITESNENK